MNVKDPENVFLILKCIFNTKSFSIIKQTITNNELEGA